MIDLINYDKPTLKKYKIDKLRPGWDEATKSQSELVPPSSLPRGFNWKAEAVAYTHSARADITNASDSAHRTFYGYHELSHLGGQNDEYKTDLEAAHRSGHYEFVRGPFYRPPLI